MHRRVLLIILDGWGLAPAGPANALSVAKTPNFDHLWSAFPHLPLGAAGESVGLPKGQIGNSEVGHLNIGAGRMVLQDLPKINTSISDGSFFHNKALLDTLAYVKKNKKKLHLLGLVSPGGVHSHENHLYSLLSAAKNSGVHDIYVHAITDGRDTDPRSGIKSIEQLAKQMKSEGVGKLATVTGRYFAMDRDRRWERTKAAYDAIVMGKGDIAESGEEAVRVSYELGVTDEFIRPTVIDRNGLIGDNDAVIFFNFRSDRPRQLTEALISPRFTGFTRKSTPSDLYFVTMMEYYHKLKATAVLFPFESVENTLCDVISDDGLSQFHISETEKYPHVTYFLEGGNDIKEKGEDRVKIPSPKVATYDLMPEMSAVQVKDELLKRIGKYDFLVVNFANTDMVGHTGKMAAAIKAVETVDACLGEVVEKAYNDDYDTVIIADHGNIEKMSEADGTPYTAHTTNKVPFIVVSQDEIQLKKVAEPKLANVAPTILSLLGIPKPTEMTEQSLII